MVPANCSFVDQIGFEPGKHQKSNRIILRMTVDTHRHPQRHRFQAPRCPIGSLTNNPM